MSKPIVAMLSVRPNVGKSTLFNVFSRKTDFHSKRYSGCYKRQNTTRMLTGLTINFTLIDTGGIEPDSNDIILSQMREQAADCH